MDLSELPSLYQTIIAKSRYARYIPEENRRETWKETVDRLIDYLHNKIDASGASEEDKKYMKEQLG
jgi:hypothetical protein